MISTSIADPSAGLPEDVFLFVSRLTPLINVDLLIRNRRSQTLLTWRDDGYYKAGWHIPGGIIRYKEKISERINAVARTELGAEIKTDHILLALNEYIHPTRKNRGHGISLLYKCKLATLLDRGLKYSSGVPKKGEWAWHDCCPSNILSVHEIYREFLDNRRGLICKQKKLN